MGVDPRFICHGQTHREHLELNDAHGPILLLGQFPRTVEPSQRPSWVVLMHTQRPLGQILRPCDGIRPFQRGLRALKVRFQPRVHGMLKQQLRSRLPRPHLEKRVEMPHPLGPGTSNPMLHPRRPVVFPVMGGKENERLKRLLTVSLAVMPLAEHQLHLESRIAIKPPMVQSSLHPFRRLSVSILQLTLEKIEGVRPFACSMGPHFKRTLRQQPIQPDPHQFIRHAIIPRLQRDPHQYLIPEEQVSGGHVLKRGGKDIRT